MDLLNLSEISNETYNLTDISFDLDSVSNKQQTQSGGFWSSTPDLTTKVDNAALEIARNKEYNILEKLVDYDLITNYNVKDKDNSRTILHYVASDSLINDKLIDKIIKKGIEKKTDLLNIQDKDGNTPLHLAVSKQHSALAEKLISYGARKDIANNQDLKVVTDSESGVMAGGGNDVADNNIDHMIDMLMKKKQSQTPLTSEAGFTNDSFFNYFIYQLSSSLSSSLSS